MSSKTLPLVLLGLVSLAVLALAFTNMAAVPLSIFGAAVSLPEGLLVAGGYILGVVLTIPLLFVRVAANVESTKRLAEWDHQDNKLAKQVQTDREKQLEAKIATLESALQKALKK